MADTSPIRPDRPRPGLSPHTGGVGGDRDRRGNGGQGRGGQPEAEEELIETVEFSEEPDAGQLESDVFRRGKSGSLKDFLNEKLPWDPTHPASGGKRPGKSGPLAPPGAKPVPPRPLTGPLARRVEGGYDPSSAVNSTLDAYQRLREEQEERERQRREEEERERRERPAPPPPVIPPATGKLPPLPTPPVSAPAVPSMPPVATEATIEAAPAEPLKQPAEAVAPPTPAPAAARPATPASVPTPAPAPALPATARCSYRVLDAASGQPVPGARFEFHVGEGARYQGQSDTSGVFRARGLIEGPYRVVASCPGYDTQEQHRYLEGEETDEGVFVLHPA